MLVPMGNCLSSGIVLSNLDIIIDRRFIHENRIWTDGLHFSREVARFRNASITLCSDNEWLVAVLVANP